MEIPSLGKEGGGHLLLNNNRLIVSTHASVYFNHLLFWQHKRSEIYLPQCPLPNLLPYLSNSEKKKYIRAINHTHTHTHMLQVHSLINCWDMPFLPPFHQIFCSISFLLCLFADVGISKSFKKTSWFIIMVSL